MKKSIKELLTMISNGQLNTEHSTQRQFLYGMVQDVLESGEVISKAGAVINSILEFDIQLPAIYFFHNTDTETTNLHDGKQRLLSLYYFCYPTNGCTVTTIINGKQYCNYESLPTELQEKLMNYEFDIVERTGTTQQEEISFKRINKSGLPATDYEILRGMEFGTFMTQFEDYINNYSRIHDSVKPISRGSQAYNLLLTCFNIKDDHSKASNSKTFNRLKESIASVRNNGFDASAYKLDKILNLFNELSKILKKVKEEKILWISNYVIRNNYDENKVKDTFTQAMREENDIPKWNLATLKTYLDSLIAKNKVLCSKRFFGNEIKDQLYHQYGRCQHVNEDGTQCNVTSYSALEVDHKVPWAEGGQTNYMNAQLLCKSHNAAKGKKNN